MRQLKKVSLAFWTGTLLFVAAGCNNLLDVKIPGSVVAADLDNPGLAQTMVSSALGEFECAYGQYVTTTGILSEEYWISGFSINSNIWGWRGRRSVRSSDPQPGGGAGRSGSNN